MIRAAIILLALVTAALLQTALLPHLAIAGFRPDLLLLVTVAFGLRDGPLTGTAVGFTAGFVHDMLVVDSFFGVYTVVVLAVGYLTGIARPYVPPSALLAPLGVAFATGVFGTASYAILARLLGDPRYAFDLVLEASVLVGLYNALLALPLFAAVNALSARFPRARAAAVT